MLQLQKKHTEEVRTLYGWHAQDYYDEMLDMTRSQNDYDDPDVEVRWSLSCAVLRTMKAGADRLRRLSIKHRGHATTSQHRSTMSSTDTTTLTSAL